MSGHSKWKTIQHKKGAADAARGRIFSKLSREIMVVARQGGGDPSTNISLRTLIQKAKAANMPSDNIDRAIKKGTGEIEGQIFEEITYEGYATGGVAIVVNVLTDNRNRAAAEIRHLFTKHNTSFATQGAVTRNFERKGQILVDAKSVDEEALMNIILEAGADDMTREGDQFEVLVDPSIFSDVCEAIEKASIKMSSAEVTLIPLLTVPVTDPSTASSVLRFYNDLDDKDDVQNVYTNMDMSDEIIAAMS
ncbi:MAG: YebC/PmpR family DNA-binding transcriptional regulator [Verrucomicrobia bacterium]|nr:YebC/PmpR family DNA-binding transcriptional regulator [Verrucomicrobiota bacterium]